MPLAVKVILLVIINLTLGDILTKASCDYCCNLCHGIEQTVLE